MSPKTSPSTADDQAGHQKGSAIDALKERGAEVGELELRFALSQQGSTREGKQNQQKQRLDAPTQGRQRGQKHPGNPSNWVHERERSREWGLPFGYDTALSVWFATNASTPGTGTQRRFYRAEQAAGLNPVASRCFLKFVLVTNGSVRFCGSSTIVVTTNHGSPFRSIERSKNSFKTVFPLYGGPFFLKYPGRKLRRNHLERSSPIAFPGGSQALLRRFRPAHRRFPLGYGITLPRRRAALRRLSAEMQQPGLGALVRVDLEGVIVRPGDVQPPWNAQEGRRAIGPALFARGFVLGRIPGIARGAACGGQRDAGEIALRPG